MVYMEIVGHSECFVSWDWSEKLFSKVVSEESMYFIWNLRRLEYKLSN